MKLMTGRCDENENGGVPTSCECVWICGQGPTRLCCQLRRRGEGDFHLEVFRNGRLYGAYQFVERMAAILFASRLRDTFEGNGWIAAWPLVTS